MMHATTSSAEERLSVGDIELEVIRRGAGRPILLLHGMQNVDPRARFLDLLGGRAEIIVPRTPALATRHAQRILTRCTTWSTSISMSRGAALREGDTRGVVLRRLARGGNRRAVLPPRRPARPRGRVRH